MRDRDRLDLPAAVLRHHQIDLAGPSVIRILVIRPINQNHNVRILLKRTRLAEIGKLRHSTLAAALNLTIQLRNSDDGDPALLSEPLNRLRKAGHFLLPRLNAAAASQKLKVVDDNKIKAAGRHHLRLSANISHRQPSGVINVDLRVTKLIHLTRNVIPLLRRKRIRTHVRKPCLSLRGDDARIDLISAHLKGEEQRSLAVPDASLADNIGTKRCLTDAGAGRDNDHLSRSEAAVRQLIELPETSSDRRRGRGGLQGLKSPVQQVINFADRVRLNTLDLGQRLIELGNDLIARHIRLIGQLPGPGASQLDSPSHTILMNRPGMVLPHRLGRLLTGHILQKAGGPADSVKVTTLTQLNA